MKKCNPSLELKEFLYCKCILAKLLQSRAQYLKIFVLGKVLNFVLFVPLVVWFAMDLQTGYLEDRYHAWIISLLLFAMKCFCFCFFANQFFQKIVFFCILAWENQEVFSEKSSLTSGVPQGLDKICKKHTEINHFLLLSCRLKK